MQENPLACGPGNMSFFMFQEDQFHLDHEFIHSVSKYLLSSYYTVNNLDHIPDPLNIPSRGRKRTK